jgi:hypothetical protein
VELEIALVKQFGWSLRDIDETDFESLLSFVFQLSGQKDTGSQTKFCDQVDFL